MFDAKTESTLDRLTAKLLCNKRPVAGAKAHSRSAWNAALKRRSSTKTIEPFRRRSSTKTIHLAVKRRSSTKTPFPKPNNFHVTSRTSFLFIHRYVAFMERTFFITSVTAQRRTLFQRDATADLFVEVLLHYRDQGKYLLHEFVVMQDHFHALITPSDDVSLEKAVQFIKGGFSFRLKSKFSVWQASFTNHRIRDEEDFEGHREYIRMNPVRARLVARAEEYRYSSASGKFALDPMPQGLKPILLDA
jgi:putative transposase